ncbi:Vacuolar protein sorting/targeting protein 10 [Thelohanellus kitauei]|uniref:Vacuolar protein sorting/targeting protein 10 n=1 Tax=Thelohanellus kitauei TaxID=669202 RepID=A0A0C2M811_THEKT|nr:Vacuolar protein sorting/targeting protein 10 [Thelohanellus kitauei]
MITDPLIVVVHNNNILQILDPKYSYKDENRWNYLIWNSKTRQSINAIAIDYDLHEIIQFTYLHNRYHIVVKNEFAQTCLFTINDLGAFVKLTCDLDTMESSLKCPVVIHPHIPGYIFANIKRNDEKPLTYISINDGKYFAPVKLFNHNSSQPESVKLSLPCSLDTHASFPMPWISIFPESYIGSFQNDVISMDGGRTWTKTAFPILKMSSINQGGVVYGINPDTREFMYSYGSNIWYSLRIFNQNDDIRVFSHDTKKPTMIINLLVTMPHRNYSLVAHVDFSNILSRTCQDDDYEYWSPSSTLVKCYEGQRMVILRIKPNTYCFSNKTYEIEQLTKHC